VRGQVLERVRVLAQLWGLERVQVLVQVLVQEQAPLLWEQWRHRNQRRLWRESSWHHASIGLYRSSMFRLCRCASCRRIGRLPL
jgi:hypothetical protein